MGGGGEVTVPIFRFWILLAKSKVLKKSYPHIAYKNYIKIPNDRLLRDGEGN